EDHSPLGVVLAVSVIPSAGTTSPGAAMKVGSSTASSGLARLRTGWLNPFPPGGGAPPPLKGMRPRRVQMKTSRKPPKLARFAPQPLVAVLVTVRNGSLPAAV